MVHIAKNAMMKLRDCSAKRQSVPPTAECMTVRPSAANISRIASSGQSNAVKMRSRIRPRRFIVDAPGRK
ncbi:hypothetical protein D3C72_2334380 [compost metagenome]